MGAFVEANLPDLFEFIRNGMSVKQSKECDGLPVTRIETISNGEIDANRFGYAGLNKSENAKWLLKRGDILFSHINSVEHIGKCALFDMDMDVIHGMNLLCFRPNFDRADPRYIKWLFRSPEFRSLIMPFVNKAVNQASISIGNLNNIRIKVPPLEEQKRIAAILDQADDIRRKRQHAIDRLNQLGQAVFYEMFLDYIENSDTHASLGEISSPKQHKTIPSSALIPDGYPVYGANGQIGYYSEYTHRERTIAITCRGATCGTINISPQTCYITGNAMALDKLDTKRVNLEYLAFALKFRGLGDVISGSAQPQITRGPLQAVRVPIPPLDRQKYFSEKIQHIGDVVEILNKHFSLVSANFQSLQHRAFTGQL